MNNDKAKGKSARGNMVFHSIEFGFTKTGFYADFFFFFANQKKKTTFFFFLDLSNNVKNMKRLYEKVRVPKRKSASERHF